jgi:ubiquinone/menaquinone biosynthesis C-methylase UbiE/DNA-binding transcriptional ArsR family regulator
MSEAPVSIPATLSADGLTTALKAVGEETRLRILWLLSVGERSVKDLTDILGQSQPRISRHLKLLFEAGLIERHREGTWVFYRLADFGPGASLARDVLRLADPDDATLVADQTRLEAVRAHHQSEAQSYFRKHAAEWDSIRSMHAPDDAVETIIGNVLPDRLGTLVDLGTGTGRMLECFAERADRAIGIDLSQDMLSYARARLETPSLRHVQVRSGDLYAIGLPDGLADAVIIHQVLHFLNDAAGAITEAARIVAPGGRLVVVDFESHDVESLREQQAHRRLGFSTQQIGAWMGDAGLALSDDLKVSPDEASGQALTVRVWVGRRTSL